MSEYNSSYAVVERVKTIAQEEAAKAIEEAQTPGIVIEFNRTPENSGDANEDSFLLSNYSIHEIYQYWAAGQIIRIKMPTNFLIAQFIVVAMKVPIDTTSDTGWMVYTPYSTYESDTPQEDGEQYTFRTFGEKTGVSSEFAPYLYVKIS